MTLATQSPPTKVALTNDKDKMYGDYVNVLYNQYNDIFSGSLETLYIPTNILELFSPDEIATLTTKISHGGVINIDGIDLFEIAYHYAEGLLDEEKFKKIVLNKNNLYTLDNIRTILESCNFKVISMSIVNKAFTITGLRT